MGRRVLILLGQPGAGKGTQARAVMQQLHIPQISTGDMLRDAIARKTPIGLAAKAKMDGGELVSDAIVNEIVVQRIQREDCSSGFILDGYPRTVPQAIAFSEKLQDGDGFHVIEIAVDVDVLIDRLVRRWMCGVCGEIYNLQTRAPSREGVCDNCGGNLVHRTDDHEDAIAERLRGFSAETQPLIDFYRSRGAYRQVNGMQPIEDVTREVLSIVTGEEALTKGR